MEVTNQDLNDAAMEEITEEVEEEVDLDADKIDYTSDVQDTLAELGYESDVFMAEAVLERMSH